jgi:hypothetical protein
MASKAVSDAVKAIVETAWAGRTPILDINVEGETPADGSAFLTIQYPIGSEEHIGMAGVGNRTFRESGAIRLVLSVPRGSGLDQAQTWCEVLRDAIRAQQVGHLRTGSPSPPFQNDSNDQGQYYVLSIVCEYDYDAFA